MRRRALLVLILVALAAFFIGASSAFAATYDAEETAFVGLLNDYRAANGLEPLLVSDTLSDVGDRHSSDMGKYRFVAHESVASDWFVVGATPFERMAGGGYAYNTYKGENIAAGYSTAAAVFAAWKDSPAHDRNLLSPNYRVLGVSLVYVEGSPYRYYWTTDFGGFVDPSAHTLPGETPTPFTDIPADDAELVAAVSWGVEKGIIQGYLDGTFRPWDPLLMRHVALITERAGLIPPPWQELYGPATRGQVRDALPGLPWDSERWDESITRSQLLRLMYRLGELPTRDEQVAAKLDAWFAQTRVTWQGVTRTPRLVGQGALMVAQAREHNVPLWLALGQCWRESQWGTTGLSIQYNVLWGVKDTEGWGESKGTVSGFTDYVTLAECVRAYFRLMDGKYRSYIDAEDWRGLLNRYDPIVTDGGAEHWSIVSTVRSWCEARGIQ